MNYQKLNLLILLFSLCSFGVQAKMYQCTLKVGEQEEKFQFDVVKNQQGTGGSFKEYGYFIGIREKKIQIKIQNTSTAAQVQSDYQVTQDIIELSQTPGWDLLCEVDRTKPKADPVEVAKVQKKKKKLVLDDVTPIGEFQANLDFVTTASLKVRYNVTSAKDRMRAIVFQKGRLYTTDDDAKRDLSGNYCIFQVQLELDQDTVIPEGHRWQTVQYQALTNSSSHVVYAYSFVDPAKGKVTQSFKRYKPFNMWCQVKKGEVFNLKMWRQITGDRIKLNYVP